MENILQPLIEELQNVKLEKQAYQKSLEVSLQFEASYHKVYDEPYYVANNSSYDAYYKQNI